MAIVIGESGAWLEIADDLRRYGLDVHQPCDIEPLLSHLRATYQPSVDRKKSEIAQEVKLQDSRIVSIRTEKGFWRRFINWFRIHACKTTIARLRIEERQYTDELLGNIRRLELLRESNAFVGARAEVNVIACLARLPACHTVFNNITLRADRYIRFNGASLLSAQIDHIVLCPAGVFVIETKRWSRYFAEHGNYHNPFDQVQRAAYLCYDQLGRRFGKIHVRSIIACAGSLPPAPDNSHVKVLAIPNLAGYIAWFKHQELSPDQLMGLRHYFEGFVTTRFAG